MPARCSRPPLALVLPAALFLACEAPEPRAGMLDHLYGPDAGQFRQISSYDTTGGNSDRFEIAAGDSAVLLDVSGPGVIQRLWITVSSADPHYLRRIALRMYWDGEAEPSVAVPLGDFFGNGFDKRHYTSLPMGVSSGGFYCYFPMPFRHRARIVVDNGTGRDIGAFYYNIGLVQTDHLPRELRTFHVWWHRDPRTDDSLPHLVLAATGSGVFAGLSLNAESYANQLWFLEGDEIYDVDGVFRGQGTGTEDYFNAGWYFDQGPFAGPYHGLIVKDEERGRIAAYRWHLADPVPFEDSIRVTIEHGHANEEVADYATTAYWYQTEPHAALPPLPSPDDRRVLGVKIPGSATLGESLIVREGLGGREIGVPVRHPDRFEVALYPVRGAAGAGMRFRLRGGAVYRVEPSAGEVGDILPPISLGTVSADREVVVELADSATPLPAAIDVQPIRRWVAEWSVVGPFPNPRVLGSEASPALDSVYEPERTPALDVAYVGAAGQRLQWRRAQIDSDGQLRLNPLFVPNDWVAAYAQVFLFSPEDRDATLLLGADDAHVLWVNGERVSERQGRHVARPDEIEVRVRLRAGWNRVLAKVADLDGGWAVQLRAADPDGRLRWSAAPR